jgi:hypothetical protein
LDASGVNRVEVAREALRVNNVHSFSALFFSEYRSVAPTAFTLDR